MAVFAITLGEGVGLLKEAANATLYPNLSKVDWYCADGLTKLASLTDDLQAAAFAVARNLTGPVYDIMATHPGARPRPCPGRSSWTRSPSWARRVALPPTPMWPGTPSNARPKP